MMLAYIQNRHPRNGGFSLLEVLIVLVIIGVVIAAVSFSFNIRGSGQDVRTTVNLLRARMLAVEQRALVKSQTYGFALSQDGYQFYELRKNTNGEQAWQIATEAELAFNAWPSRFDLGLSLPNVSNALIPNQLPERPMIVFTPAGTVTPFTLQIGRFELKGKASGEIEIKQNA